MKPLYFSRRLNQTLLAMTAGLAALAMPAHAQQVAFTWDDLPSHSSLPPGETRAGIMRDIINAMKAANLPPARGFVNGIRLQQEPESAEGMEAWEKAGLPIGNHTWSHMNLNQKPLEEWEKDFERNEPVLAQYAGGQTTTWVRFPFLAEGDTDAKRKDVRAFLAERHYKIAAVTMSFQDYAFNQPYARCVKSKDAEGIAKLEAAYLSAADDEMTYRRSLAKAVFGHDIPYVLLMHVGGLDARMLPRLLELFRRRGFSFVTLEQAESDPFYANDLDLSLPSWPDTLEGAAQKKGVTLPTKPKELDPETVCR